MVAKQSAVAMKSKGDLFPALGQSGNLSHFYASAASHNHQPFQNLRHSTSGFLKWGSSVTLVTLV
jgi:hypothetical protein